MIGMLPTNIDSCLLNLILWESVSLMGWMRHVASNLPNDLAFLIHCNGPNWIGFHLVGNPLMNLVAQAPQSLLNLIYLDALIYHNSLIQSVCIFFFLFTLH